MKITSRFAILPVNRRSPGVMVLKNGEKEVYAFHISYAPDDPEYLVYADLRSFLGQDLSFFYNGRKIAPPSLSGEASVDSGDRPRVHFTAPWGWINDPNGLSFYRGKYRLFCQHNPFGDVWGNMHWGYAESENLLTWTWKGEALYPERIDSTEFSGSAVVDEDNTAGFGCGAHILIYTEADETNGFTQNLAWSSDGEHYEKYAGNPVIPTICRTNRDPKVIRHPDTKRWILALYLEGDEFALFSSDNLLSWQMIQRFSFPEANECPDFFPLQTPEGEEKWVFWEAGGKYLIGDFDGRRFTFENRRRELTKRNAETAAYAAQTVSGDPKGRRLLIFWEKTEMKGLPYTSQHSIPLSLSLIRADGECKLRASLPSEITERLAAKNAGDDLPFVFRTALNDPVRLGAHLLTRTENGIALDGKPAEAGSGEILFIADRHSLEFLADGGTTFGLWEAGIDLKELPEGAEAYSIQI